MDERIPAAPGAGPTRPDEPPDEPLRQLCLELDAFCERADPILTRLDHLCAQLPRLLRRVATPW